MEKLESFYKNRKVFVTGHTGFKGSWLVSALLSFGAKVYGYSIIDHHKKNYQKFCDFKKVKNFYGNILDDKKLFSVISKVKPDMIFHLAAQPLVSESYVEPKLTINTNVNGTLNILESVRKIKTIKSAVIITSDKCYQNNEILRGYNEADRLGGDDPYSASKAAVEIIFNAYLKSNLFNVKNLGIATARAGNVIGGGDWSKNRIIPDCAKSILKNKKLIMRNPNSTRPWQHVLEPISGYLVLGKKLRQHPKLYSSSYNFGPSDTQTLSVKKVVDIFFKELGVKKKIFRSKSTFKESKLLKLNSYKSRKKLYWKNTWGMKKSIEETAKWYKQYIFNKIKLRDFTLSQIKQYFYD
jgi:CDP-glucose 4,6-dehydratase